MIEQQNFNKTIYLADDDEDDRMFFLEAVRDLNMDLQVKEAEDGDKLLHILYQPEVHLPEIIFLDINMPGKNGFECLKEIRNGQEPFNEIKVIMFSTSSSTAHIDLSYELGADFYAVKPSTFSGLKKLLRDIITIDWTAAGKNKTGFLLAD